MNTDVNNLGVLEEWNKEPVMVAYKTRDLGGSDGPVSAQPRQYNYNQPPVHNEKSGWELSVGIGLLWLSFLRTIRHYDKRHWTSESAVRR